MHTPSDMMPLDGTPPPPDGLLGYLVAAIGGLAAVVLGGLKWLTGRTDKLAARQDEMHEANRREAMAREERMQKRADDLSAVNQTQVMVLERLLGETKEIKKAVEEVPRLVADELDDPRRRPKVG